MKAILFLLGLLFAYNVEAQHWTDVQDTILTNNVYYTYGTKEAKWEDARLVFRYDGELNVLLKRLGELHKVEYKKDDKKERYVFENTTDPFMFYAAYDAVLDYHPDYDCYTLFVRYSFDKKKEKGSLIHDTHTFFIREHYQPILNDIGVSP